MGEEIYRIFKTINERMGGKGRLLLAEKTGVTMARAMEVEDSEEMLLKFNKAVKEIDGDISTKLPSTAPAPAPSTMPEKDWKRIGNQVIEEIIKKLAKFFGKDFAENMMAPEKEKIEKLGTNSSSNDIKTILLPKVRKKFKEIMNPKEIDSWFDDILNKFV